MKRIMFIIFIACGFQLSAFSCMADTIYTKDNKELKGIVVEDYKDRIIFSTPDGEKTLMKTDIRELYYDTEEQNLIKLAEQSRERGDFIKAFVYYDKAFRLNPESRQAKDGIVFMQGYLFKKDMAQKEEVVRRHNEFEQFGRNAETVIKSDEQKLKEEIGRLKSSSGITIRSESGVTKIYDVTIDSPAYEAGIRTGDILVAIWGKLVGYMTSGEVVETMLEKNSLETKCTIEREVNVRISGNRNLLSNINDLIGITLNMQFDGLTVSAVKENGPAAEAGLKPKDLITEINGNPTRYMPLKRAIELIKKSKNDAVNLVLRREAVMWGKGGG